MRIGARSESFYRLSGILLEAGVLFLLAYPPLVFGAVESHHEQNVVLVCFGLGFVLLTRKFFFAVSSREEIWHHTRWESITPPLLAFSGLIIAYGLLLAIPLPASIHSLLSPASTELYRESAAVAISQGNGFPRPLSVSPVSTLWALSKLAAFFIFFFVCLEGFSDWKRNRRLVSFLIGLVFVVSLLSIIHGVSGSIAFFRSDSFPEGARPFGPFVNRNHFAAWAFMGAFLGLGYLFSMGYRRESVLSGNEEGNQARHSIVRKDPNLASKRALLGFMTIVIMSAVFLSRSRGGVISFMIGMAFFGIMLGGRKRLGRTWLIPGILILVLLVVVWLGADLVFQRLSTILNPLDTAGVRVAINRDMIRMHKDFMWTGTGPGTFGEIYPLYRTANLNRHFTYAHNDVFQMVVEWGIVGAVLFLSALSYFWWKFLSRWRVRRRREILFLAAGAAGGLMAIAVHSLVDFNLHIPSNAMMMAFIAAFALKSVNSTIAPSDPGQRQV